jgi:hypothetical protein
MKNNIERNALIGLILILIAGILTFGFKDFMNNLIGTFFSILLFAGLLSFGFYLMLPYINELDDPNKPWNKDW